MHKLMLLSFPLADYTKPWMKVRYLCGFFLDLAKAFDTVNQNHLLEVIEDMGIRGIDNDLMSN